MLVNPNVIERYVWVVSYKEPDDSESTITVFDDETEARKCFKAFKDSDFEAIAIDKAPVYSKFWYN